VLLNSFFISDTGCFTGAFGLAVDCADNTATENDRTSNMAIFFHDTILIIKANLDSAIRFVG